MNVKTATIDLLEINTDTFDMDKTEYMVWLGNKGVHLTIVTRLESLWEATRNLGEKTIYIGRIIIAKIVEFIEDHPHAVIGMAIGAIVGAFASAFPFLGALLAPLAMAVGAAYGYCAGARLDYDKNAAPNNEFETLILIAKDFIKTLIEIFSTLKETLFGENDGKIKNS